MSPGPWQIALIVVLLLVFFGRGKISEMMGDVGKGIKSFKKGISDSDEPEKPAPRIEANKTPASDAEKQSDKQA